MTCRAVGGTAHCGLVHFCIAQALLHRLHALAEEVHVELLKAGTCDGGVEVNTLKKGVNLNAGLC